MTPASRPPGPRLADDEDQFAKRLAGQLTLIATIDGAPVAFASLRGNDHIDMLYVHPAVTRQGVATSLVDALEKLAGARGATTLSVDASDTAKPFFDKRGYSAQQRNAVAIGGRMAGQCFDAEACCRRCSAKARCNDAGTALSV